MQGGARTQGGLKAEDGKGSVGGATARAGQSHRRVPGRH